MEETVARSTLPSSSNQCPGTPSKGEAWIESEFRLANTIWSTQAAYFWETKLME